MSNLFSIYIFGHLIIFHTLYNFAVFSNLSSSPPDSVIQFYLPRFYFLREIFLKNIHTEKWIHQVYNSNNFHSEHKTLTTGFNFCYLLLNYLLYIFIIAAVIHFL